MIDLYTWGTPNGRKVSVALEELGLAYQVFPVNIGKDEQFAEDFLRISPNNKIPAIVDHDAPWGGSHSVFESGAILIYLADKTGRLMPKEGKARYDCLQWLMWQMGGLGPMLGQTHHFRRFAPEQVPYAIKRFDDETTRLYGVLEKRLGQVEYLIGEYSIADIACYPWIGRHEWQGQDLETWPNVKRWFDAISARPAVQRGFQVP